jgi:hypothetical protein
MIVDKRVVAVLLFGLCICIWCIRTARVFGLRELADACVMAELVSRTFKHKQ